MKGAAMKRLMLLTITAASACALLLPAQAAAGRLWKADGTTSALVQTPPYIIEREWSAYSDDHNPPSGYSTSGEIFAPWLHPDMGLTSQLGDVLPNEPSYRVYAPAGETRHELK